MPVARPETRPPETDAKEGLLMPQTPPEKVSDNVMVEPVQTIAGPEIVPASGNGLIVNTKESEAVLHELATE